MADLQRRKPIILNQERRQAMDQQRLLAEYAFDRLMDTQSTPGEDLSLAKAQAYRSAARGTTDR
ncbi:MAG: hypothetical protein U5K75_05585 [Ahrensia sp.]|nr:hypothetical protein [Ahrensia sp.]